MCTWEIPREKGITLRGGLELQLKHYLRLKRKERNVWEEQLWGGYQEREDKPV